MYDVQDPACMQLEHTEPGRSISITCPRYKYTGADLDLVMHMISIKLSDAS